MITTKCLKIEKIIICHKKRLVKDINFLNYGTHLRTSVNDIYDFIHFHICTYICGMGSSKSTYYTSISCTLGSSVGIVVLK